MKLIRVEHLQVLGHPQTPTRAYPDDAGYDLYTSAETVIEPRSFADVPTGVAIQLPNDCWGMLTGRSSTLRKLGLLVHTGIIDTGYRGELFAGVWNLTDQRVVVEEGMRLAQIIIMPNETMRTIMAITSYPLDNHPRGQAGFGSSGK